MSEQPGSLIPEDVRELLRTKVSSLDKVALVVELQSAVAMTMSVEELARTVDVPRETVRQSAIELLAVRLVELTVHGELRLSPHSATDLRALTELARLYADDRPELLGALGEIALERVRRLTSSFSDDVDGLRRR